MQRNRLSVGLLLLVTSLGIGAAACGDDDDDSDRAFLSSGAAGESAATSGDAAAAPGAGGAPPLAVGSQLSRKIIFNAAITLEAGDVAATFDETGRIANVYGGYVEKSSLAGFTSGNDGSRSAMVTIRVPADRYQETLGELRRLRGTAVREESARSAEVTEEYADLESRLRNLERTEQQYLLLMERATTINDILAMTDRLDGVRLQIEQVQGRINYLDNLTGLATIDVAIFEAVPARLGVDGGPQGIGDAFVEAWRLSVEGARYFAVGAAYVLVAGAWLLIPVGLVLLVLRLRRPPRAPAG